VYTVVKDHSRPYTLDHGNAGDTFLELQDRTLGDKARIGGLGKLNGQSLWFIGQQKDTILNAAVWNFGMAKSEGYRK
jgi:acetyl-CoA carboxylase carboxyl transferase subunit alpha